MPLTTKASTLWYASQAHTFIKALASGKPHWSVENPRVHAASTNGEVGIECKSGIGAGSSLTQVSHHSQRASQVKMREHVVGIGLNATTKPVKRLKISVGVQLRHSDKMEPKKGARIARRQPKRLLDVSLDFLVAPQRMLSKPDERMRLG